MIAARHQTSAPRPPRARSHARARPRPPASALDAIVAATTDQLSELLAELLDRIATEVSEEIRRLVTERFPGVRPGAAAAAPPPPWHVGPEALHAAVDEVSVERGLSAREREILMAITAGVPRHFVPEVLGITENTTKTHVRHIARKFGLRNLDQVAWHVRTAAMRAARGDRRDRARRRPAAPSR